MPSMLSHFLFVLIICFSFSAKAKIVVKEKTRTDIYDDAVIKVCKPKMVGCFHKIVIEDKDYRIIVKTEKLQTALRNKIRLYQSLDRSETTPFTVEGRLVKVTGLFPDTKASIWVFEIKKL